MNKVILTQEQAEAIEGLKKQFRDEIEGFKRNHEHFVDWLLPLKDVDVDDIEKSYYDGYEVEPEVVEAPEGLVQMSKERLEEAKTVNSDIKRFHDEFNHKQADIAKCYFYEKYGKWLIKQAERVQELEDIIYKDERQAVLEALYENNQRYKQALEQVWEMTKESIMDGRIYIVVDKALKGDRDESK